MQQFNISQDICLYFIHNSIVHTLIHLLVEYFQAYFFRTYSLKTFYWNNSFPHTYTHVVHIPKMAYFQNYPMFLHITCASFPPQHCGKLYKLDILILLAYRVLNYFYHKSYPQFLWIIYSLSTQQYFPNKSLPKYPFLPHTHILINSHITMWSPLFFLNYSGSFLCQGNWVFHQLWRRKQATSSLQN